jgi:hypothetical protein
MNAQPETMTVARVTEWIASASCRPSIFALAEDGVAFWTQLDRSVCSSQNPRLFPSHSWHSAEA